MSFISQKQRSNPFTTANLIILGLVVALGSGLIIPYYPAAFYFILAASIAIVILLIISQRAEWGLLLSIFLIVVQKTLPLPAIGSFLTLSEIVFLVTALAWFIQNASQQIRMNLDKLYAPGLFGPFFFYTLVAVISILVSFYKSDIVAGFAEILVRVYLMVFLVVVASYATTDSRYYRILLALVASAILVVALIPFANLEGLPITRTGRFTALFRNPNALAGYISGALLLFLPFALTRRSLAAFPHLKTLSRLAVPGLIWALVLTDSQGAYIAVGVGMSSWLLIRKAKYLGPIMAIIVLVSSSIFLLSVLHLQNPNSLLARFLAEIGYESGKLRNRFSLLENRFQTISDHPFTGVGMGQAGRYRAYSLNIAKTKESHFTFIGIITETGVLGLLAVGIIVVNFLRFMWENASLEMDKESGWLQLNEGLSIAFIGMIMFGLTHDVQTNRTLWVILTLIVCFRPAFLSSALIDISEEN